MALVGLALAAVALWLRRSVKNQTQLRDVEIDRRLRGRSEMEAELVDCEVKVDGAARRAWASPTSPRRRTCSPARRRTSPRSIGGRPSSRASSARKPFGTLATARDAAALEIEQKTSALEALGPIAKEPRARERLEVEVRDQEAALERARDDEANARARVEANAVDAEQVAGAGRAAGRLARAARRGATPPARLRADARRDQTAPSRRR